MCRRGLVPSDLAWVCIFAPPFLFCEMKLRPTRARTAARAAVLAAVAQDGGALSAAFRADRPVVLAAVAQNGGALWFADPALQADRGVVLAAVTQDGWALRWASDVIKADREVMFAAVVHYGRALGLPPAPPALWLAWRAACH